MPSDPKALDTLCEMRDAIVAARSFVTGLTSDQFAKSQLHFYAATRAIEIISEASRRLPDDVRGRHPHLPWRAIRDSGNFYRHQYDNVAGSQIWAVIHDRLPELLVAVQTEIERILRSTDDPPHSI